MRDVLLAGFTGVVTVGVPALAYIVSLERRMTRMECGIIRIMDNLGIKHDQLQEVA